MFLCFIFFTSPMFQYSSELHVVKHSILDRSFPVHLVHIIISEPINRLSSVILAINQVHSPVTNCGEQLPESIFRNKTNILFIKTAKCILKEILIKEVIIKKKEQNMQLI